MTTIAFDGKTLVTDSLITCGSTAFGKAQKLYKLKNGSHVAFAGRADLDQPVITWLEGGARPDIEADSEISGLIVDKKGNAFEFDEALRLMPACVPWAGGSGQSFALAAMYLNKTAEEAVELACVLDTKSRGPLQVAKVWK